MAQPTRLIVCPTSHMDWDWVNTFEQYYKLYQDASPGTSNVQCILQAATALTQDDASFMFSVAELGWLQRYHVDLGGSVPYAPLLTPALYLMGGAITSPDNLVCNGEVYIRTYLLGRQWAHAVGLDAAVTNVAWMPDDFGHDPELPVILAAMGLTAVGFARVPGAFPLYAVPLDSSPSLACTLLAQGVTFHWQASDTSTVTAHFMPNTYGVPFQSGGQTENATDWLEFIQSAFLSQYPSSCGLSAVVWPGSIAFAPAGGDFCVPDSGWVDGVTRFNTMQSSTTAAIGT